MSRPRVRLTSGGHIAATPTPRASKNGSGKQSGLPTNPGDVQRRFNSNIERIGEAMRAGRADRATELIREARALLRRLSPSRRQMAVAQLRPAETLLRSKIWQSEAAAIRKGPQEPGGKTLGKVATRAVPTRTNVELHYDDGIAKRCRAARAATLAGSPKWPDLVRQALGLQSKPQALGLRSEPRGGQRAARIFGAFMQVEQLIAFDALTLLWQPEQYSQQASDRCATMLNLAGLERDVATELTRMLARAYAVPPTSGTSIASPTQAADPTGPAVSTSRQRPARNAPHSAPLRDAPGDASTGADNKAHLAHEVESVVEQQLEKMGTTLGVADRQAVERRAVAVASMWLESQGYNVTDVGATESFDLDARKGPDRLFVEVKGTTSAGREVVLTSNEVKLNHEQYPQTMLVLVHHILLDRSTWPPVATAGMLTIIHPWKIELTHLTAINYRYAVPDRA